MTILKIYKAPSQVLKTPAKTVSNIDSDLLILLDDMLETMYHSKGIGLAANQVGILSRVLVMDIGHRNSRYNDEMSVEERESLPEINEPLKLINPEIIWSSEQCSSYDEGCLSFPGQYAEVVRPAEVRVKYLDIKGKENILEADGLLATCVQHEIDHLNGVTFVDHISRIKRDIIMRKMKKAE